MTNDISSWAYNLGVSFRAVAYHSREIGILVSNGEPTFRDDDNPRGRYDRYYCGRCASAHKIPAHLRPHAVTYSHTSKRDSFASYADAVAHVRGLYLDAVIGHDGDLESGGNRTLCWADEESSRDDDGAHAVCSIWRAAAEVA